MAENKCYGCTRRHIGCHSKCEDYKDYLKRLEQHKKEANNRLINRTAGYYHK